MISYLLVNQISESQRDPLQRAIEPETKIVQTHLGRQACLEANQAMGPFTGQPKGMEQFIVDGLYQLSQTSQPSTPLFGPVEMTRLVRKGDHLRSVKLPPFRMGLLACKPFVGPSADRAWFAIARFYDSCKTHKPGKKGYPRFQHDNRSVEYKQTGWKLEADGKHLTFTDGCGIGRVRLVGNKGQRIEEFPTKQIKRVRIIKRADGYFAQFAVQADRHIEHIPTDKHLGIDMGLKDFLILFH